MQHFFDTYFFNLNKNNCKIYSDLRNKKQHHPRKKILPRSFQDSYNKIIGQDLGKIEPRFLDKILPQDHTRDLGCKSWLRFLPRSRVGSRVKILPRSWQDRAKILGAKNLTIIFPRSCLDLAKNLLEILGVISRQNLARFFSWVIPCPYTLTRDRTRTKQKSSILNLLINLIQFTCFFDLFKLLRGHL